MNSKITKCKICGADIAQNARECPYCGAYRPPVVRSPVMCGALCIVLMLFVAVLFYIQTRPHQKVIPASPIEVSISDLLRAYQENEINADGLYNGKLLSVTGEVASISTYMGMPCVTMYTGAYEPYLICLFDEGADDMKLSDLRVGDVASLQGNCSGTHAGGSVVVLQSPGYTIPYVYLNGCCITSTG